MALRLIEMLCDDEAREKVQKIVEDFSPLALWHDRMLDGKVLVKILLHADESEEVMDELEEQFSWDEGFRLLVSAVEATVPRPDEKEEQQEGAEGQEEHKPLLPTGISRHEIAEHVESASQLTAMYAALLVLSTIVGAVGLMRDNVAVVIGAMVIAPLLGPSVGVALGTTLGDVKMVRRALRTMALATLGALALAVLIGFWVPHDVSRLPAELTMRAQVDWPDVVLALAAGTVGALAFTTGIHTPLVGVMVAVALLPPLVATGLLAGAGLWLQSVKALLLYSTNLVCIMLAAVGTFMLQGVRPRTWWEADEAKRSARRALLMLTVLALLLLTLILVAREADEKAVKRIANTSAPDAVEPAPESPASEASH